jgi:hypothetical protein
MAKEKKKTAQSTTAPKRVARVTTDDGVTIDDAITMGNEVRNDDSVSMDGGVVVDAQDDDRLGDHDAVVARRAYELYAARGYEDGHDLEDWLTAEREI